MSKFGITQETKSKNLVPFNPPIRNAEDRTWKFPSAKLVQVLAKEQEKKDGSLTQVLQFIFVSADNVQTFIHTEWELEEEDSKFDTKLAGMQSRIKHIYEAFATFPEKGIGTKAKNIKEFFATVAKEFNVENEGKKLIDNNPVWIKLTYYKNRLQFPLSPNFIEAYVKDKKCKLTVNLEYDSIEQIQAPSANTGISSNPMVFTEESGDNDFPEF